MFPVFECFTIDRYIVFNYVKYYVYLSVSTHNTSFDYFGLNCDVCNILILYRYIVLGGNFAGEKIV